MLTFNIVKNNHITYKKLNVYLTKDNWDDFGYKTTYRISILDEKCQKYDLGLIKIAKFDQSVSDLIELPTAFESLDDGFFSLGQSTEYYSTLQKLEINLKETFLRNIKDIAFDIQLQEKALKQDVTLTSLLRETSKVTLQNQYKRILAGGAILTPYNFKYEIKNTDDELGYELLFDVEPESNPPTNIHVLIGRNGVGKTHLLNDIINCYLQPDKAKGHLFQREDETENTTEFFSRLAYVSYSVFDSFTLLSEESVKNYSYIGLKQENSSALKDRDKLALEFFNSINHCFNFGKREQWLNAIKCLESDPLFREIGATELNCKSLNKEKTIKFFKKLSSGHSIVLLTITKLIEKIEEKTLVLLDEPESHLHPPLQSSFIRALSDLLVYKNAIAIIATHSPVIVQEVPKRCIWKLSRFGREVKAERFEEETFGESMSKLTREIFGLEINNSGFYKLLNEDVNNGTTYNEIIEKYDDQLGSEAKLLLRALLQNKTLDPFK